MRQMPRTEAESHHWPILEPLSGDRERAVALNKPVCVAGDRARVNLPLPSENVSRAHAIFLSDEHGIYVRDLASKNHLFVNDEPVREADLHDGDRVAIGPYVFRCDAPADAYANGVRHAPPSELRTPDGKICVPLTHRSIVIGRREDCDVVVDDKQISPAHAVIFELDGRHCVRDLRSRQGTFVNDKRIGQSDLRFGDQLRIAEVTIVYQEAPVALAQEAEAHEPSLDQEDSSEAPPAAAASSDELSVIPLMEDSGELKAMAAEFAEDRGGDSGSKPAPVPEPAAEASESGIIPLLDESEVAPGALPDADPQPQPPADDDLPVGLALDEDDEPPHSILGPPVKPRKSSDGRPPGSAIAKPRKDQNHKRPVKSGARSQL